MACSGSSGSKKSPPKDSGVFTLDGNKPPKKDTGGGGKKDTGGGGKKDKGTTTQIKDCTDIANCVSKCSSGDQTCMQKCISAAPAKAQTLFKNYSTCLQTAAKGTCATPCAKPSDAKCTSCLKTACKKQIDACNGTGGPPTAGFGAKCTPGKTGECKSGLECVGLTAGKGWCTKTCTNAGKACNNAPTGTAAYCAVKNKDGTKYWCAFVCKIKTSTWKCPPDLKCGTVSNQQAFCEPK